MYSINRRANKIPAKSKAQRKFMGIVHAIQKGKPPKKHSPAATKAAATMSEKAALHFAKTKEKNLPKKKRKK